MSFLTWVDHDVYALGRSAQGKVTAALELARRLTPVAADLGRRSAAYLRTLASLGAADLTVARVVEPHLDAMAILSQTRHLAESVTAPPDSTWGVFAAQAPWAHIEARPHASGWRLSGVKPWCSLATDLSHAIVTAQVQGKQQAFAVSLRHDGVRVHEAGWHARGLREIRSTPVEFDDVPVDPVGPPGWYLGRPGFWWGGIGVAAVWWGGAAAVAEKVLDAARRREPDQVAHLHLGRLDAALTAARVLLTEAALLIDASPSQVASHDGAHDASPAGAAMTTPAAATTSASTTTIRATPDTAARNGGTTLTQARTTTPADEVFPGPSPDDCDNLELTASRVRNAAAHAAECALQQAGWALGPAPLTFDEEHARRAADLTVYVRQHHGERDIARTGALLLSESE